MYLQNKYTQCYYNIVDRAKARSMVGYFERHHIIPKSLGGSNDASNLVALTAREHFICHWLLTKMLPIGKSQWKMFYAFNSFNATNNHQQRHRPTSKQYEIMKKSASIARSNFNRGNKYSEGKTRSAETIEKWRESRAGYKQTESAKIKQSNTMKKKYLSGAHPLQGITYEEKYGVEAAARKAKLKGPRGPRKNPPGPQQLVVCPHCRKTGGVSNMKRYHFDNCSAQ
jgi:hypothetical protein